MPPALGPLVSICSVKLTRRLVAAVVVVGGRSMLGFLPAAAAVGIFGLGCCIVAAAALFIIVLDESVSALSTTASCCSAVAALLAAVTNVLRCASHLAANLSMDPWIFSGLTEAASRETGLNLENRFVRGSVV